MTEWSTPIQRNEAGAHRDLLPAVGVVAGMVCKVWLEPEEAQKKATDGVDRAEVQTED